MQPAATEHRAKLKDAVALLKLLSHPVRLSILCNLLHNGEMTVSALVAGEGNAVSQSQVSQFLAKMRDEELVECRKSAQNVYYKIKSPEAQHVVKTLYTLYCDRCA